MTSRAALVVVALLLGSACGSTTRDDASNASSPSFTPEEFAVQYASAHCELTSRCCDFSGGEPQTDDCEAENLAQQRADAAAAARRTGKPPRRNPASCSSWCRSASMPGISLTLRSGPA